MGVLKPYKLLKCVLAGGEKGKLFCNFFYCKCACLCAGAGYNLREPCYLLSGGCRKCVKLSYNYYGVKNNFTGARHNFTGACHNLTVARRNFIVARRNLTGACRNFTDARYNYAGGCYMKMVAYFTKLLDACKFQAANCFVLGTCRTENRLDICFNVYRSVNKACPCFIKYVVSGNAGIN